MHWKRYKHSIAALVKKCLAAQGQNCQAWERRIDTLIARLYGRPYVSYIVLADMIRAGWRLTAKPIKED